MIIVDVMNLLHCQSLILLIASNLRYSLPNDKCLEWSKITEFLDKKLRFDKKVISVFDSVENMGKRRKCWLPSFSHNIFKRLL